MVQSVIFDMNTQKQYETLTLRLIAEVVMKCQIYLFLCIIDPLSPRDLSQLQGKITR
jgi:hypothetical protein